MVNIYKIVSKLVVAASVSCFSLMPNQSLAKEGQALKTFDQGEYAKAFIEIEKLARAGNPAAMNNIAVMYATGRGVKTSYPTAAKYYMMAAEQGLPVAQYNIGNLYERGLGVEKDLGTAAIWYRLAAAQGDVLAQLRIGILNVGNKINGRSNQLAYYWLSLAARRTTHMELRAEALTQRAIAAGRLTADEISAAKEMADQWQPMP